MEPAVVWPPPVPRAPDQALLLAGFLVRVGLLHLTLPAALPIALPAASHPRLPACYSLRASLCRPLYSRGVAASRPRLPARYLLLATTRQLVPPPTRVGLLHLAYACRLATYLPLLTLLPGIRRAGAGWSRGSGDSRKDKM